MRPVPDFPTTAAEDAQNAAAQDEQVQILRNGLNSFQKIPICMTCIYEGFARYDCRSCGTPKTAAMSSAEEEKFAHLSAAIAAYSRQQKEIEVEPDECNVLVGLVNAITYTIVFVGCMYGLGWLAWAAIRWVVSL